MKKQKLKEYIKNIVKEETEYQKFFKKVLDEFGVSSPKELSGDKEKEFYDYVDKNWKGSTEKSEANEVLRKFVRQQVKNILENK